MHYVDQGEGTPVVFVHGVPGWSFHFRHLLLRLSAHQRCIALDHLGFGLSDKPVDWDYPPEILAGNVSGLMDELKLEDVVLVVHDWGGARTELRPGAARQRDGRGGLQFKVSDALGRAAPGGPR